MNNLFKPDLLHCEQFPRSNKYDPIWIFDNEMGPHPLWLAEYLTLAFDLKPGMRVLDLACGKGMTSVFLAREFGVQVYGVDLWDNPEEKWKNAKKFDVEHLICPIQADAKSLPFAQGFFDAIVCINSFMYFGMDDSYLENILKFLRQGGQIGMIVTGFMKDIANGVPEYLQDFLGDELWTWQTLPWYRKLWERTGLVTINVADTLPNGCELWLRYDKALFESGKSRWGDESHYFLTDKGEYMGFIRLVATKN